MTKRLLFALLTLSFLCVGTARAEAWKPAAGPLATQWAKDVTPEKALPEYPRPQMVRQWWQNLNGLWDYAIAPEAAAAPSEYQGKILVPFAVESALSGVMKPVGEKQRLWYHRTFQTPAAWKGQRVLLHFQAVDWEATVSVNGKEVGSHRGGYDAFTLDITDALKADGDQDLVVKVFDPTDGGSQPRGKQVKNPGGIMYTSTTGIWQTAWLEPVPAAHIDRLTLTPDVDGGCLRVTVQGEGATDDCKIKLVARDGQTEIGQATGVVGAEIKLPVAKEKLKLWTPDEPNLYDLSVTLTKGEAAADEVQSYFAMRKVSMAKDTEGYQRLLLNDKFVFQVGPLDQGFWPDGLYTAPTDEALRFDIEITKKLGMNMARKHVKVEPQRWYYWCDKLGLLVWQDMPAGDNRTAESKKQFELELRRMIEGFRNHPSIIMWVVFNEGWGQHDTPRYVAEVQKMDPSRLVNNASGWTDMKVGSVIDMHNYPGPGAPKPEADRASVLGEFGGLGLAVPHHTWSEKSWGYRGTANFDDLTRRYCDLLRKGWGLKDTKGLCALVYTQTTDVETECNGLLTYDRKVVKVHLDKAAPANRGELKPAKIAVVVPTSEAKGLAWRYTTTKPSGEWFRADFDDAAWKEGPGGFGTAATPGATVRTEWKTSDIWIRRTFDLPETKTEHLGLMVHHDEDCEIYLNGVLAARAEGFVSEYEPMSISAEARATLKTGKNKIAIHCHQTQGGQYIDAGLIREE